jgi:putative peptide zinc metalloprotease protein
MELFLAAIAAIIWANTGEGLLHSIAFNIMVAGSVSSLLFNANPLLKFDAYFILSDYLEIPNLYQRSHAYTLSLMEKVFFGIDNVEEEKRKKESIQLVVYGILSYIYKLILTITIVIFVADQWFEIGVIVFIVSLYTMVLKPVYKFFIFIMSSEKLYKNRTRAKIVTAVLFTVFAYFFFLYESDDSVKANGTVNLKTQEQVYVTSEGILEEIYIANSQKVQKGDKLFKLSNKELDFTIEYTRYQLQESKQKRLKALNESLTHIKPIEEKIDFLTQKLEHLEEKKSDLIIKANTDGLIVFNPHIKEYLHSHLKLNSKVADILQHSNYEFISVIPQEEARELFEQNLTKSRLKLAGNIPNTFELTNVVILPHEKHTLPSLALSWQGGGNIETIQGDDGSFKTAESFFELRGDIVVQNGMKIPYQDQYGTIKIVLDKITLYERTIRYISQVLQKRYRL